MPWFACFLWGAAGAIFCAGLLLVLARWPLHETGAHRTVLHERPPADRNVVGFAVNRTACTCHFSEATWGVYRDPQCPVHRRR